jgi:hypothetical protein
VLLPTHLPTDLRVYDGIPKSVASDEGTHFMLCQVQQWAHAYGINFDRFSGVLVLVLIGSKHLTGMYNILHILFCSK